MGTRPTRAAGAATLTAPGEVRGDPSQAEAFRRIAERHLDGSYRLAAVILGDAVVAQDAVHDAFVTAWRKWHTLRDVDRFEAWFRRIVVNTCRNQLRRSRRWQIRDISAEVGLADDGLITPIEDRVVIRRALDRLPADDRIVLALRYYHDMKVDDVATAMGIRSRAVASRIHRALGRLRDALDEDQRKVAGR